MLRWYLETVRTKLSLALVLSFIASALYSWRHKGNCIHVHVPYASCRECSLYSYSYSLSLSSSTTLPLSVFLSLLHSTLLHQDPSSTFPSFCSVIIVISRDFFALSNFLTCSLLQLLIFYVALVIITPRAKAFQTSIPYDKGSTNVGSDNHSGGKNIPQTCLHKVKICPRQPINNHTT